MAAASFVIATRNRVSTLRDLLTSIRRQTVPLDALVMDDGASDALQDMLGSDFPDVRYYRLGTGRGPAFQRNRGIELASSEIVFPFDDDTCLVSSRTVEQTLSEFDDARIGAVGIPFVDTRVDERVRQRAPAPGVWIAHAYIGAAHALRRSVFLRLGGYRENFFYMGEEGDFCLRLLAAGYVVRAGNADPVHHLESPSRNLAVADYYGRRNDIRFAWHNVPLGAMGLHLLGTTINGLRSAADSQNPGQALLGMLHGYGDIVVRRLDRRPVPWPIYRLHRRLKKSGPIALEEIEAQLPKSSEPTS